MKDPILENIKLFLKTHLKDKSSILLGYSGGWDSKALFYLLLECMKDKNLKIVAISLHGPNSKDVLKSIDQKLAEIKKFQFVKYIIDGIECLISRNGYKKAAFIASAFSFGFSKFNIGNSY